MTTAARQIDLYGRLSDVAGTSVGITVPTGPLRADAIKALAAQQHPALAAEMAGRRIVLCVNDQIVGDDAMVAPDDRVALFPPLSGG